MKVELRDTGTPLACVECGGEDFKRELLRISMSGYTNHLDDGSHKAGEGVVCVACGHRHDLDPTTYRWVSPHDDPVRG